MKINEKDNGMTFWTPQEAAAYLSLKYSTLAQWRVDGTGPPYYKIGGAVRYRQSDIDEWLSKKKVEGAVRYRQSDIEEWLYKKKVGGDNGND